MPSNLQNSQFRDVALATLNKFDRLDRYSVFADAVDEAEAPDYYEIVKNPMTMLAMHKKVEEGVYGEGTEAAIKFYEDFLLMFDNCALYNDEEGEVMEEAARIFGLVPETYAAACKSIAKKKKV